MDLGTLIGMVGAAAVVVVAIFLGGSFGAFIDVPSLLIVIGGGPMATLLRFDLGEIAGAFKIGFGTAFSGSRVKPRGLVEQISELARVARKDGLMGLENIEITDPFLKKGIQLCVDGLAFDFIRDALTRERDLYIERLEEGERVMRALGDAAPAFGMIGTLVGLVQMLANMSDPAAIGPAMAVALLTTLYGALVSNLVAIPIADKLAAKLALEQLNRSLVIEGTLHIQAKTNPDIMVEFLNAYLPETQRIVEDAA
jgi:chemotaxis protein MotA